VSVANSEGQRLAEISNAIVKIFSEYYGRGPTKAKTYAFDDYVLCVLEDILTTVERTLVESGQEALVRAVRLRFQETVADQFKSAVAEVMGRPVIAYHSQVTFNPSIGFEMFVLGNSSKSPAPETT
jgi:uncharacterized protein YbcI